MSSPSTPPTEPTLHTKLQPAQPRASATFERIVAAAAQVLQTQGIERFSTNLVCKEAGVSPPALYRYFPNKYALLCELAQRLMQRQNQCIPQWIQPSVFHGDPRALEAALAALLLQTYEVTRTLPAGVWIMRAMRAVPVLHPVRLASHREVAQAQAELLRQVFPQADPELLALTSRTVVELMYAAVEMLFDEPLQPDAVAALVAPMMASPLEWLRG